MYLFSHELYVNINRSTYNFISLTFSEHLMKIQSQERKCLAITLCFSDNFQKISRRFETDWMIILNTHICVT